MTHMTKGDTPSRHHDDGWILTSTGVRFQLFRPEPWMFRIQDIAHALANVCRFGGHPRDFYSVAQHSIIVSAHVPPAQALTALLHDATEAYLGDMVRPLKREMAAYKEVEERCWHALQRAYLLGPITPEIKEADERALQTERRDLMVPTHHAWALDEQRAQPFDEVIVPMAPAVAREAFLLRFHELTNRGGQRDGLWRVGGAL